MPLYLLRGFSAIIPQAAAQKFYAAPATPGRKIFARPPPLKPFEQHGELRRGQRYRTGLGDRPGKPAFLKPLGEQAEALAIPIKDFYEIAPASAKREKMARKRVLLQHFLRQHR